MKFVGIYFAHGQYCGIHCRGCDNVVGEIFVGGGVAVVDIGGVVGVLWVGVVLLPLLLLLLSLLGYKTTTKTNQLPIPPETSKKSYIQQHYYT